MVYRVDRNNFYEEQKKATIYTPNGLSKFIFQLFKDKIDEKGLVLDPCVGRGSLLRPFVKGGFDVLGVDVENQGFENTIIKNYLEIEKGEIKSPSLVIMNPPFNIDIKTKAYIKEHYGGRPLLPEVWLSKSVSLFGSSVPIVMFTPYGFRLNQSQSSKRWKLFEDGTYPEITSIISLPKDVFDGILFHSEILIFNINGLKAHYFYHG